MPQTAASFDLTVCGNIKSDVGTSSTSDGTVGCTANGMHVRRGQDTHIRVPDISASLPTPSDQKSNDTHFQVLPEIYA
jgi:hypothetical protein